MTTAWSNVMHARFGDALRVHASGALLAGVAMIAAAWSLSIAVRGKHWGRLPSEKLVAGVAVALAGLVLAEWIVRVLLA